VVVAPGARGSLAGVLILVRHGRTALNAEGRLQGRLDEPLDEVGLRQAAAIAEHVGAVDVLISSPLRRATQTAEAFSVSFETDERWIELSYGIFEGVVIADAPSEAWDHWQQNVHYVPEGGESLAQLDLRVRAACEGLSRLAGDSDVAVVSHVSPIKSAVAWALGATIAISWRSHLAPASICRIEMRRRGPVLTAFNETVSLPD
jgi:alpha-ribazole phosphatase